jgi:Pyruvate/2-oxoacid:ferredoxin oxidoreductase gamma subunit
MLGKAPYPDEKQVADEIRAAEGTLHYLDPFDIPADMRGNLYTLGAVCAHSRLKEFFSKEDTEKIIADRWPKVKDANIATFRAGYSAPLKVF